MSASAEFRALGTTARLVVADDAALDGARAVLERELDGIDRAASRFRPDSEISLLEATPRVPRRVGRRLLQALAAALWAARVTDGMVDPTVGAAMRASGYDRDFAELGDPQLCARPAGAAPVPGWRSVMLDRANGLVCVPAGVQLDLGATAKALTADRAARRAQLATGSAVLVSLGGDVAVAGDHDWRLGVADHHGDEPAQTLELGSGGLATSSTTARTWTRAGVRLHHIIDPATGEAARSPWRTVSVAAGSCLAANTASTAAIVLGERAPAWLAGRRLPARLVAGDGDIVRVAGWPEDGG